MKTPPVLDRLICWSNKEPILTVSSRRRLRMPRDNFFCTTRCELWRVQSHCMALSAQPCARHEAIEHA